LDVPVGLLASLVNRGEKSAAVLVVEEDLVSLVPAQPLFTMVATVSLISSRRGRRNSRDLSKLRPARAPLEFAVTGLLCADHLAVPTIATASHSVRRENSKNAP
jgi:hypothetical protein